MRASRDAAGAGEPAPGQPEAKGHGGDATPSHTGPSDIGFMIFTQEFWGSEADLVIARLAEAGLSRTREVRSS
jgi:hypothetical protein